MSRIKWQALEYTHREKGRDWFWAVSIITASLAVTAILFKNLIFALLIILGAFTLMIFAKRQPRRINFSVDEDGVRADKLLFPFSDLESFWLEDEQGNPPKLLIKSKRSLSPLISIPIENVDPQAIKALLKDYLPLEKESEPLSQKIMEFLGF